MPSPTWQFSKRAAMYVPLNGQMREAVEEQRDRELEDYLAWLTNSDDGGAGGSPIDEVWIGNDQPANPALELWYDPDATSTGIQLLRADISMASRTLTPTAFTMGTIDFGTTPYPRLILVTCQALFSVATPANYWDFYCSVGGATARRVRTRQISQPCSAYNSSMVYVPADTVLTASALVTTDVNATGSTAGSSDFNVLQGCTIPAGS